MRKLYIRRLPLMPYLILFMVLATACTVELIIYFAIGKEQPAYVLCKALTAIAIILLLTNLFGSLFGYSFTENDIRRKFGILTYGRIPYKKICCIIISNAVYNDTATDPNLAEIPQYEKSRKKCRNMRRQYPYITLLFVHPDAKDLYSGMNCRAVIRLFSSDAVNLGIAWTEAVYELLAHTSCDLIILEDVYLRFEEQFSGICDQEVPAGRHVRIIG